MLKKIVLGALLTGLIAALVAGAVIRTNAVNGEGAGETGRRGRVTENAATNGNTQRDTRSESVTAQSLAGRGGRWGQGGGDTQAQGAQDSATRSGLPQAGVLPAGWLDIEGAVVSVADDLVEIRTAAGATISLEGQPLSFAREQGLSLKLGDTLMLAGFEEDGAFRIGQVTNLATNVSVTLRDANGRPAWAGRGRRG
jgi:hypothetical protein